MQILRRIAPFGLKRRFSILSESDPSANLPLKPKVIYLEVSYQCNLKCTMCTRHFEGVPQVYMEREVFEKAAPDLRNMEHVLFVGWGEPLMSPYAVPFLRALGGPDYSRGFSTNGLLLKGDLARQVFEQGAYSINVSIDAGRAETYEWARGRNKFDELMNTLRSTIRLKRELGSRSNLIWVFILMKSNFRELPRALELAIELGFDQFAAKHMETAQSREGLAEAMYDTGYLEPPSPDEQEELETILDKCRRIAEGRIQLHLHPVVHGTEFWGLHKPFFKMFMDYEGNVTACSFISPNDTKPYTGRPFDRGWILGNVKEMSLEEMIASPKMIEFQRSWIEGKVPAACEGCLRVARMGEDHLCHAL
jgi:MoaA/NifB/PqqE/SkfB family radical SAM enzyme